MEIAVADFPLFGMRTKMIVSVLVAIVVAGPQRCEF